MFMNSLPATTPGAARRFWVLKQEALDDTVPCCGCCEDPTLQLLTHQ